MKITPDTYLQIPEIHLQHSTFQDPTPAFTGVNVNEFLGYHSSNHVLQHVFQHVLCHVLLVMKSRDQNSKNSPQLVTQISLQNYALENKDLIMVY